MGGLLSGIATDRDQKRKGCPMPHPTSVYLAQDGAPPLKRMDTTTGFPPRSEFAERLAGSVTAFPHAAKRWARSQKPVRNHLYLARRPGSGEYYLNNGRIRREANPKLLKFTASGTTGSEALNLELNRWFHGITHTRGSAHRLKLRISRIAKLKAF